MLLLSGTANRDHFTEESIASLKDLLRANGLNADLLHDDMGAVDMGQLRAVDFTREDARDLADEFRSLPLSVTLYSDDFCELTDEAIKIADKAGCEIMAYFNGVGVVIKPEQDRQIIATQFAEWMGVTAVQLQNSHFDFSEHRSLNFEAALSVLAASQLTGNSIQVQLKETLVRVSPDWKIRDLQAMIGINEVPKLRGCLAILGISDDAD